VRRKDPDGLLYLVLIRGRELRRVRRDDDGRNGRMLDGGWWNGLWRELEWVGRVLKVMER
jgi:hypothetical protein